MSTEFNRTFLESLLEEQDPAEIRAEYGEQLAQHPECELFLQIFESLDERLINLAVSAPPELASVAAEEVAAGPALAAVAAGPVRRPVAPSAPKNRRPWFWWTASLAAVLVMGILFVERNALRRPVQPNPPVASEAVPATPAERTQESKADSAGNSNEAVEDEQKPLERRAEEPLRDFKPVENIPSLEEQRKTNPARSETKSARQNAAEPEAEALQKEKVDSPQPISQQDRAVMDQSLYGKIPQPPASAASGQAQQPSSDLPSEQNLDQEAPQREGIAEPAKPEKVESQPYFQPETINTYYPEAIKAKDPQVQAQELAWAREFFKAWASRQSLQALFGNQPELVFDERLGFASSLTVADLEARRPDSFSVLPGNQVRLTFPRLKAKNAKSLEGYVFTFFVTLDTQKRATVLQILFFEAEEE